MLKKYTFSVQQLIKKKKAKQYGRVFPILLLDHCRVLSAIMLKGAESQLECGLKGNTSQT